MRIDQELVDVVVEELASGNPTPGALQRERCLNLMATVAMANNLDRIATALEAFTPQMQPAPEETPEPDVQDYSSPACMFARCPHPDLCRPGCIRAGVA